MNDMRRVEKRKCDLIPAVKVTWDISPNDSVTVTLLTLCSTGIGYRLKSCIFRLTFWICNFLAIYLWASSISPLQISASSSSKRWGLNVIPVAQITWKAVTAAPRVSAQCLLASLLSLLYPFSSQLLLCYVANIPTITSIPLFGG